MANWGQYGFQDSCNSLMECITYFHDYMMMLLLVILVFVSYSLIILFISSKLDKIILDSHYLEFIWTVIPMIFLLLMAYPSLLMLYYMEAIETSMCNYNVKVIGHQWYWEYEFPQENWDFCNMENFLDIKLNLNFNSNALEFSNLTNYHIHMYDDVINLNPKVFYTLETLNSLHLPVNKMITMYVTSADVLHAWTVPACGVKVDAVPGRINVLYFHINMPGVYYGQCSEICGANHSFMPIAIKSMFFNEVGDLMI